MRTRTAETNPALGEQERKSRRRRFAVRALVALVVVLAIVLSLELAAPPGTAGPQPAQTYQAGKFAGEMNAEMNTVRHVAVSPRSDCAALGVGRYRAGCVAGEQAFLRGYRQ